jgi:hypothetical protein
VRAAIGDLSKFADYENLKKRLTGSRYTMDFSSGVTFDLTVVTSDSTTAGMLSGGLKLTLTAKKMSASPGEKIAVENTTVDSDGSNVAVHFKASDQQFQSLMHSDLFAAMTH